MNVELEEVIEFWKGQAQAAQENADYWRRECEKAREELELREKSDE